MLSDYTLTNMERKIESLYKERNIFTPADLTIQNVAEKFNIKVDFSMNGGPQRVIWDEDFTLVFIDPDLSEEEQREVFFHELGHPQLHAGNQLFMNNQGFRELQESQAHQFQLYSAIPFFMLKELEMPETEYQMVKFIQCVFKVPGKLARKRLEQIKRRILQNKLSGCFMKKVAEPKEPYGIMECAPLLEDYYTEFETKTIFKPRNKKPKVYYDFSKGKPEALWYCIDVEFGEINWSQTMHLFPIDAKVEFLPIQEYENMDSDEPVWSSDLILHPSHPNDFVLNLTCLKEKLKVYDVDPYNIRRFVISVSDLEHLLQLDVVSKQLQELGLPATN